MAVERQKGGRGHIRGDPTLEFKVPDPKIERLANLAPDKEPHQIRRFQDHFKGYRLVHSNDPEKLDFDHFVKNIRAGGFITLCGTEVDVFFTRTAAFVVFEDLPDFGRLNQSFPRIDFVGKTSIVEPEDTPEKNGTAEGKEERPTFALIRANSSELVEMMAARPPGESRDLIPAEIEKLRIEEVREMVLRSSVQVLEPGFDPAAFCERIAICSELVDGEGEKSYYIALKDSLERVEDSYSISGKKGAAAVCQLDADGRTLYINRESQL
ncbi:MAG: hypothetical protein V1827_02095 [Candidatus Micrarchaeota archaeon]